MSTIVLDKCFLQGSKASRIRELAASHRLLVSDGLFYELLTTKEPDRSRCFAKFPESANPVDLISHIGTLVHLEIQTHRSAGKPSAHKVDIPFRFNAKLLSPDYQLPEAAKRSTEELFIELRDEAERMLDLALTTTASLFPDVGSANPVERPHARVEAVKLIVAPGALLPFLDALEAPSGGAPLPPITGIDESWAIYRWLQIKMLLALDIYSRFQGSAPVMGPAAWERLEHDILDAQVLALGCLEGAFATSEKKLIKWFHLLCPDGRLYQ